MTTLFVIFGLLAGTIASHVAEALMTGRRLAKPICPYCSTSYTPLQWSATLALAIGKRCCAQCGKPFRWPRLAGELFTALTWGLLAGMNGVDARVVFSMLTILPLTMILVTDLEAKRVPNVIILPAIGAILILSVIFGPALPTITAWTWWYGPAGALTAFIVLRIFVSFGVAVFGPGAMGEGDITLATYTGAVVGFPLIIVALLLTIVFGGIGAFGVLATKRGSLRTAIPYGPFIILGCAVAMLWGPEILLWYVS